MARTLTQIFETALVGDENDDEENRHEGCHENEDDEDGQGYGHEKEHVSAVICSHLRHFFSYVD